jgi:hypothetical protein
MRHHKVRIAVIAAAAAGSLAGVLTTAFPSGAASSPHTKHKHAKQVKVIRGPRGPRGFRGPQGPRGFTGPASPLDAVTVPLTINWFGGDGSGGVGSAGPVTIPGIGALTAECDAAQQQLVLTPASSAGTRTVGDVTTFQGEGTSGTSSNQRIESYGASTPVVIPLPTNGMLTGTFSVEPDFGAGGPGPDPVSFIFSSEWKLNGTAQSDDFCAVAGQLSEHS